MKKNQRQIESKTPTRRKKNQPVSEAVVRREMRKLSPTARLLKGVAAEKEPTRAKIRMELPRPLREALDSRATSDGITLEELCGRTVRRFLAEPPPINGLLGFQPLQVVLSVPGILAGMAFDQAGILKFLMETIHELEGEIDGTVRAWIAAGRAIGRSPDDGLAARIVWHEVALLANEFCSGSEEFNAGLGQFNSPFDGIAGKQSFCERSLTDLLCEFLYDYRDPLSVLVGKENEARRPRLNLAEALAIAEQVMQSNGNVTELDEVDGRYAEPTRLQLQMWETRAASIAERYTPVALAA